MAGRGRRLLQDVHLRAARHHRQPASTARPCRPRTSSATTATTPTSWSPPTRAPRRSPTSPTASRKDYGFWLGDAFASRRLGRLRPQGDGHHRPRRLGLGAAALPRARRSTARPRTSPRSASATCRGDVFGNGHALLRAHPAGRGVRPPRHLPRPRHPTPATSYAERKRLFDLPRSSWQDYDKPPDLRGRRRLPALAEVDPAQRRRSARRSASTSRSQAMTPAELMKAILQAPVDLLWNGGIGTYVKGEDETHADAGDKANDAIRVDGRELRAKCVGEGGNLGLTQRGPHRVRRTGRGRDAEARSTPTSSTTPPASTPPTTRSTSRSCSTGWSPTATSPRSSATTCSRR